MPGCSLTGEVAKQLLASMSGPKRDGRGTKDTKAWALQDIETCHRHHPLPSFLIARTYWEVILYLHGLEAHEKVNPKRTSWNAAIAAGIFACHLVQPNQLTLASQTGFLHLHMGDCFSSCITESWYNHYVLSSSPNFPFSWCSIIHIHFSCSLSSHPQ